MTESRTDYLSASFLERVRRSYKLALRTVRGRYGRIWETIDQQRAPVHAALLAETDVELRNIFSNPVSSDLFLGVDPLCHSILGQLPPVGQPSEQTIPSLYMLAGGRLRSFDEEAVANHFRNATNKKLSLLARECGVQPSMDHENTLRSLDRLLGQRIVFPNFPAELGLVTSRGTASFRAVLALYNAWRALTLLADMDDRSIIEIGPGAGRTAYYAYSAGITDYTTVDLPIGIVSQACFLGKALGPDKIWLPADDPKLANGRIRLLVEQLPDRNYGLALNTDSLTEMTSTIAQQYLRWISQHCRFFLSINYDKNYFTVDQLATKWFKLENSHVCPVDEVYAEQVFKPRAVPLPMLAWHRLGWHRAKIFVRGAASSLQRRIGTRIDRYWRA
jgi:hypothetical protein